MQVNQIKLDLLLLNLYILVKFKMQVNQIKLHLLLLNLYILV